jgi:hypothetical protein
MYHHLSSYSVKGPSFPMNKATGGIASSVSSDPDESDHVPDGEQMLPPLSGASNANPPLRIMAMGRPRRVKGRRNKAQKASRSSSTVRVTESSDDVQGILLVFLVVAMFVALEVILVDRVLLAPNGRIANMEVHIHSANVFVSNIAEASLNRYRLRPDVKLQRLEQHQEGGQDGFVGDNHHGADVTI